MENEKNYYVLTSDGELYHAGIKGMRWGVRRFQNPDGTLTAAGKKRQAKEASKSDDHVEASRIKKKKISEMSNSELKKLNERTRLEQEYSRLNKGPIRKGWAFVAGAVGIMSTTLALYNQSNQLAKIGKGVVDNIIKT